MYYALILLAVVLIVATFCFGKRYRLRVANTLANVFCKITLEGLFAAALFFCLGGFRLQLTPYTVVLALLMALVAMGSSYICFQAYGRGNLSLFAVFQMQGGMLLPYLFGIWYGNRVSVFCVAGIVLMVGALLLTVSKGDGQRATRAFRVLCVAVFFCNGAISILSYIYSNGIFGSGTAAGISALYSFVTVKALFSAVLAAGGYLLTRRAARETAAAQPAEKKRDSRLVLLLLLLGGAACDCVGYVIELLCAGKLPAVALFPMVTGGTVILSALAGMWLFGEKVTARTWVGIGATFAATILFMF